MATIANFAGFLLEALEVICTDPAIVVIDSQTRSLYQPALLLIVLVFPHYLLGTFLRRLCWVTVRT